MVLILTGTINPSNNIHELKIKNSEQRFKQYYESIDFFVKSGVFKKIIFCDNSNTDINSFKKLLQEASSYDVNLELLSFKGNKKAVEELGKGYGEGEIMQYIMHNSKIINEEKYIIKITGRLKIDNIKKIVKKIDEEKIYFNISQGNKVKIVDTRFYGMPKKIFEKYFLKEYVKIKDDKHFYLEHLYTEIILKNKLKTFNFNKYPRIVGISGSTGVTYSYSRWKSHIKDILSIFNIYSIKRGV